MAGKGHRKKKSGPKAEKRKAAVKQKQGLDDAVDSGLKEPNKRSGALASRGRAVKGAGTHCREGANDGCMVRRFTFLTPSARMRT